MTRLQRLPILGLATLFVAAGAGLSGGGASADEPAAGSADEVPLDQLLKLPDSYQKPSGAMQPAGASADEWRTRFAEAEDDIVAARDALRKAQEELDEIAVESSSWQVSAPGASDPQNSPLSFKLRQEIKRQRAALEAAERRRRELTVEANLAGVPEDWRD